MVTQDPSFDHVVAVTPRGAASYEVVVGRGLLGAVDRFLPDGVSSLALVCDETVADLYAPVVRQALERTGLALVEIRFPAGEASKTRATKARIEDAMFEAGLDRHSLVVALGGGVTSDLAGFVAATFMRGIATINLPTTLLAMVDATVGGKTGIDTPAGKNLVGAFHHPLAVAADVGTLRSLDPRLVLDGLAEMIKHAVVADEAAFAELSLLPSRLDSLDSGEWAKLVADSIAIKAGVVSDDPTELGRRRILNFGHTIGHGLELLFHWRLSHGRAVALGMVAEARIAEKLGLLQAVDRRRIEDLLDRFGVLSLGPVDSGALLKAMARDKKNRAGRLRMALPSRVGAMHEFDGRWVTDVPVEVVVAVVEELWGQAG